MKIGRNDLCPCGSGKKYKKCCLNKTDNDINEFSHKYNGGIFSYHYNYIHKKEIKAPEINKK